MRAAITIIAAFLLGMLLRAYAADARVVPITAPSGRAGRAAMSR
jgi:hypothetical protein